MSNAERMPPVLIGRYLAPFVGHEGVTHLLALARAVRPADLEDVDLAQVRAHTMIVRGEKDAWVESDVSRKLSEAIADSRLVTLPEAARLVPEEAPDDLATLISAFISPHVGRTAEEVQVTIDDAAEPGVEDAGTRGGGMA